MIVMPVVRRLKRLRQGEEGQAMVEYALLLSLVTLVTFAAVQIFGHGVAGLYSNFLAKWQQS